MRKIAAFFTAVALFLFLVIAMHFATSDSMQMNNPRFGTWPNAYKDASYQAVAQNITKDTMLVFGSSEFHHGYKGPFHADKVLGKGDTNLMLIGAALNQSLSHAISLAALEPNVSNRKAVLVVSPSWFVREGVSDEGFGIRFSESNYMAFMENENISRSLKTEIAKRSETLLDTDPAMQTRVENYNKRFLNGETNLINNMLYRSRKAVVYEKEKMSVLTAISTSGLKKNKEAKTSEKVAEPDWKSLYERAFAYAKKNSNNDFYMIDRLYNRKIYPVLGAKKDSALNHSYGKSPEYGDLEIFLKVCKETGIKPMIMILPVNGYWYDYTGFPKEGREAFHKKILEIADEYGAETADFFDECYTPYFLEDAVHPGGKGWVRINEEIYKFYNEKN
ncbi:MAG: D-alanyl-lipoteichoic acid biosynthesis protein DltD [Eubacteriales bacterium]|nr:D-alanyl-lipoteichoic acid biosynthesis protein DltD [Eubacteriales bacterium]